VRAELRAAKHLAGSSMPGNQLLKDCLIAESLRGYQYGLTGLLDPVSNFSGAEHSLSQ
jgi:hypothetical protein